MAAEAQCASVQKWTIDGSSAVWLIFKLLSHPPMHMGQNIDGSDDDPHHVGPLLERSPTIGRGHGMGGTWDMRHMTSSLCRIRDRLTLNQRARFSSFCELRWDLRTYIPLRYYLSTLGDNRCLRALFALLTSINWPSGMAERRAQQLEGAVFWRPTPWWKGERPQHGIVWAATRSRKT